MLRKYDECIGRRYTSAGEVYRQTIYLSRRYTSPDEGAPVQVYTRPVYTRVGELEAGSWIRAGELQAAS